MSETCLEALADVWDRSGGPPGVPGQGRRPLRMSLTGRKALPDVRDGSGGPLRGQGGVGRPS